MTVPWTISLALPQVLTFTSIKASRFLMQYSTVPEYRMKEERCKLGLRFAYGNLSVTPMLSVPTDGEGKHIRLLCSFDFSF